MRERNQPRDERQKRFVRSIPGSYEGRKLHGPTATAESRASFYLASRDVDKNAAYYRFEGVLVTNDMVADAGARHGVMITDQTDKWALIDKLRRAVEELNHARSLRRKAKPQRERIQRLVAQIEPQKQAIAFS